MSVTQVFLWTCLLLSPRVIRRGYSPILVWMLLLFCTRYLYGMLLSNFPLSMADSTRDMIRPMFWAWILAAVLRDDSPRKWACDCFVLGGVMAGLLHLGQARAAGSIAEALSSQRISAFELNANVLGVIYATTFIIALARVIQPRTGYRVPTRFLFGGAGVIVMLGLLLTGSRTAALFATIGSVVLVLAETRRARWSAPAILASLLLLCGVLGIGMANSIVGKRSEHVAASSIDKEDRARMAPILVEQFLRSPLIGLGPENYRVELGHRSGTGNPAVGIVSHNQLFMFAVEMGLFGLVPFLAICGLLITQAWKIRWWEGGLPLALAVPVVITACTTANIAFHWHFHFIVGLVAGSFGAWRKGLGTHP
jgi:O-antigen ligase